MKSAMSNPKGNADVINMLSLWLTPELWQDKTLFAEIKVVIQKLSEPSYQLSERELFLIQELTYGLFTATLSSFDKAENFQKDGLALALNDITKFQIFLLTGADTH